MARVNFNKLRLKLKGLMDDAYASRLVANHQDPRVRELILQNENTKSAHITESMYLHKAILNAISSGCPYSKSLVWRTYHACIKEVMKCLNRDAISIDDHHPEEEEEEATLFNALKMDATKGGFFNFIRHNLDS